MGRNFQKTSSTILNGIKNAVRIGVSAGKDKLFADKKLFKLEKIKAREMYEFLQKHSQL